MSTTVTLTAKSLEDTIGSSGLVAQINAILAPLLTERIDFIQFKAKDKQRRNGMQLDALINYEAGGDVVLTSPFVFLAFTGRTLSAAVTQAQNFQTANPAFWYSGMYFNFINEVSGPNIRPFIVWVVYSEDPNAGGNWGASGSSSGGLPAGANTEVQYNNAGAFGANANFKYIAGVGLLIEDATPAVDSISGALIVEGGIGSNDDIHAAGDIAANDLLIFGNPSSPFVLQRINIGISRVRSGSTTTNEFRLANTLASDIISIRGDINFRSAIFQDMVNNVPFADYQGIADGFTSDSGNLTLPRKTLIRTKLMSVGATSVLARQNDVKVVATVAGITLSLWTTGILEGDQVHIRNASGGNVTIDTAGAETINSAATLVLANGESVHLVYKLSTTDWLSF